MLYNWQVDKARPPLQGLPSILYLSAVELCVAKGAEILVVCDGSLHHQHFLIDSSHIFWGELGRFWNL